MAQKIQKMIGAMTYVGLLSKHFLLTPIAKMLYGNRNIWIVCERGTDARDNGFCFFRYVRENHPQQKIYYIIEKNSPDYSKVAALGNEVQRNSLMHWLLFLGAEVRISTHNNGGIPGNHWRYKQFISCTQTRQKVVFLQHGVTKDDMKGLYKEHTNINLFICGAKPEYDYILGRFGYNEQELKYTGFARFDALHQHITKRQVLIMPTWRDWLSPNFHGTNLAQRDLEDSLYIERWKAFLNNARLSALAQKYDIQFVFYPHYEMQPFLHLFGKPQKGVVFADFANFDVQQLLKESMLLITDYSSVFFDFAYMCKPVLYYQFDEEEYRAKHYAQGYYDYRQDGFGEVVTGELELIDTIDQYLEQNCQLKPKYRDRIQGFFPMKDTKNCERIYNEICKL